MFNVGRLTMEYFSVSFRSVVINTAENGLDVCMFEMSPKMDVEPKQNEIHRKLLNA